MLFHIFIYVHLFPPRAFLRPRGCHHTEYRQCRPLLAGRAGGNLSLPAGGPRQAEPQCDRHQLSSKRPDAWYLELCQGGSDQVQPRAEPC